MISSDTFAVTISLECNYLMCDRTDWHDIKSVLQHMFHLLIQKAALLLPAGSRDSDFLWIFRSAFFASYVHSYRPESLDLLFFVVSLHLAVL
mgnify:FL=1